MDFENTDIYGGSIHRQLTKTHSRRRVSKHRRLSAHRRRLSRRRSSSMKHHLLGGEMYATSGPVYGGYALGGYALGGDMYGGRGTAEGARKAREAKARKRAQQGQIIIHPMAHAQQLPVKHTVSSLRKEAKKAGIIGYSTMRKAELLHALGLPSEGKARKARSKAIFKGERHHKKTTLNKMKKHELVEICKKHGVAVLNHLTKAELVNIIYKYNLH